VDYIVTFLGKRLSPIDPEIGNINIEDIAHSLSLLCRANGHIRHFFSVAQHSINCANEAKARGHSAIVQLACLIHDASEAYISDVTRPVKFHLSVYKEIEKHFQDVIYTKFLGAPLDDEVFNLVDEIDNDMLINEFRALRNNYFSDIAATLSSEPSFELRDFQEVETEFLKVYYGIMHAGMFQGR